MKKYFILSILLVFLTALIISVHARTWTSENHSIEGEFRGLVSNDTIVRIQKTDGTNVRIPLDKLSQEDQNFIKKRNWYAFIVGVDQYDDDNIPKLECCVSDAKKLAEKFKVLGFPEENIILLVDSVKTKERPTKDNIETRLKQVTSQLPENSLIIFSFAGHGSELKDKGACFLPTDANISQLDSTVVYTRDVSNWLEDSKARVKLMLVDACRKVVTRSTQNFRSFNKVDTPTGLAVLQSCSYGEYAFEDSKSNHGYFTLVFLEAMDGKADMNNDGVVTLNEVFSYTSKQTESRVLKDCLAKQRPFYSFNGATIQDFPFVTGLLVDGLTKAQRDEAEKLYEEADEAFINEDYKLAQENINKAVEIYGKNEKYKKLKNIIDKMVKAEEEKQHLVAQALAAQVAQKKAEEERQRLAEEKRQKESEAEVQRQAERKAGDRLVKIVNSVEFAFRWCPAETFMMGSPTSEEGRYDDETQHHVTLTKGFWIMETEVTQKQWKAIMGTNPSYFKGDDIPVEKVSWDDCQEFCKKCAGLGLSVCLPTEAQWEYACRAGSTTAYFWGNSLNGDKANCDGNYPCGTTTKGTYLRKTTPVKSYSPNSWGIYDMHGNVWEWCEDWCTKEHHSENATDTVGPSNGSYHRNRGGSWRSIAQDCRSALRGIIVSELRSYDLGFRVVLRGQ